MDARRNSRACRSAPTCRSYCGKERWATCGSAASSAEFPRRRHERRESGACEALHGTSTANQSASFAAFAEGMKVALLSESPADETALRVFVTAVLKQLP